jgi:hypothetical protein
VYLIRRVSYLGGRPVGAPMLAVYFGQADTVFGVAASEAMTDQ